MLLSTVTSVGEARERVVSTAVEGDGRSTVVETNGLEATGSSMSGDVSETSVEVVKGTGVAMLARKLGLDGPSSGVDDTGGGSKSLSAEESGSTNVSVVLITGEIGVDGSRTPTRGVEAGVVSLSTLVVTGLGKTVGKSITNVVNGASGTLMVVVAINSMLLGGARVVAGVRNKSTEEGCREELVSSGVGASRVVVGVLSTTDGGCI